MVTCPIHFRNKCLPCARYYGDYTNEDFSKIVLDQISFNKLIERSGKIKIQINQLEELQKFLIFNFPRKSNKF